MRSTTWALTGRDRRLVAARRPRSKLRCRRISPGSCWNSAASSIRPRPRRSTRRCRRRSPIRAQGRARRQIRTGRAPSARRLHAGDECIGPAGADLHPWRRFCCRQQAQSRQSVLRQHHAVGGEKRLRRRQRHLPAGAAIRPIRPAPMTSPPSCNGSPRKISERGGDPARIFLMGQSAGAVHVANYVSHPELHKVKGGGLAGAIMVSGIYDLTASPVGDAEITYFGSDPSRYAERSSLRGLLETKTPLMIDGRRTRPAALHRAIRTGRSRPPAKAPADARAPSCCRSTVTCRRSMRSTPRIRG